MEEVGNMSIRRNLGDILIKKKGGGFTSEVLIVRIPTLKTFKEHGFPYTSEKEDQDNCMCNCGDSNCVEYANLEVLNKELQHDGWIYHVSECQLEDLP
jgi:hypothetical protein